MLTPADKQFFLEQGYFHARRALAAAELAQTRTEFDRVLAAEGMPCQQHKLLKHPFFIALIEHPAILGPLRALFGRQLQLLQYDLVQQEPRSKAGERGWHRDFSYRGDFPLSVNAIIYLDDMVEERGPTRVVPGSHLGTVLPPKEKSQEPLEGEVPVYADAGDVLFINSAVWHSGGRNRTDGLRRGIFAYYGYWWLKRYDQSTTGLPWQAFENASTQRLELLGVKMPGRDIHMYDPVGEE